MSELAVMEKLTVLGFAPVTAPNCATMSCWFASMLKSG